MSVARKIFSNTAWQIFGKAATAILGIVSVKVITNYLSRSTYGEYTTIYDYTALFAIIADFGLFTIGVREMAHNSSKQMIEKIVGNVLAIRTVLATGAFALAVIVAYLVPAYHGTHIPLGVFIVSLATIITLIAGTMSSVLQFYLRMHWASIALTIGKIVTVAYILATVLYIFPNDPERGFPHLQLAWIMGALVTLVITQIASSSHIPIRYQFDFSFWKDVLIKALPYGAALMLGTMYFRMGTISLSWFGLKNDVGYFGVPLRFLEILQIIPNYFMNSVLPLLTISLKDDMPRSGRIIKYCLNALGALGFPILVGGCMLAWPIIAAVSSPQFLTQRINGELVYGSDMALKILLIAMVLTYFHVVLSYVLVAMGRQSEILKTNAVVVTVNIILNFSLAQRFGFIGASVVAAISEFLLLAIQIWRVHRHIKNIWDFSFLAKTAFSATLMGGVLFACEKYFNAALAPKFLPLLIVLGVGVFAASMFATKAVSKEMLLLLRKTEDPTPMEPGSPVL